VNETPVVNKAKDRLFTKLAQFLRDNVSLVADARDSNDPWDLLSELQAFKEPRKEKKAKGR
jgi:hypothetical protein